MVVGQETPAERRKQFNYYKPADLLIVDIHHGMFASPAPGMQTELGLPGMNIYAMKNVQLGPSRKFYLGWGLGFSAFNVHLNGQFAKFDDFTAGPLYNVFFAPFAQGYEYQSNRVTAHFAEIPLEFRFRTNHLRPFKFSLGATVGYAFNTFTTTKDSDGRRRIYDVEGVQRLRYGLTGRMGVGRWSVFGFYSLSTFLQPDELLRLTPVTLGLNIQLI